MRVLDTIRADTAFHVFYDALPIAGVDGIARNRMKGTPAAGKRPREDGLRRQRALAFRLRDHGRRPPAALQPAREQLDDEPSAAVDSVHRSHRGRCSRRCKLRDAQLVFTVADAVARIIADIEPLGVERVPLLDALGRVLATPIVSPLTLPAWDNSAMDGYALRASDVEGASATRPVTLARARDCRGGRVPVASGRGGRRCTRIMTGAPLPEGADTVIRLEDTDGGIERVDHSKRSRCSAATCAAAARTSRPARSCSIAASRSARRRSACSRRWARPSVDVYRQPRVAFFGSGDEIVDLDRFAEALDGKKIVTSNSYTLNALVRLNGGIPVNLGVARDDPADIRARIDRAAGCDLLITSAGISAGEFDYLRPVLAEAGVTLDVWKVRMRPGAPLGFGWLGKMPWIGLPGNPVSTMVTFELFVRPVMRRMLGHTRLFRQTDSGDARRASEDRRRAHALPARHRHRSNPTAR